MTKNITTSSRKQKEYPDSKEKVEKYSLSGLILLIVVIVSVVLFNNVKSGSKTN